MQGCEDGMRPKLARLDLDRRPRQDATGHAVGDARVGEVITNGVAVWQVNRLSPADRQEWPEAEIGHSFHIAFRVAAGVLVENGEDRKSHRKDSASFGRPVNAIIPEASPRPPSIRPRVPASRT